MMSLFTLPAHRQTAFYLIHNSAAVSSVNSFQVNPTAKVVKRLHTTEQTVRQKQLQRTDFIIGDRTAALELTLLGPPEQLLISSTYTFHNLTVKMFGNKKLSRTITPRILRADDIDDEITKLPTPSKKTVKGQITGVSITSTQKCSFCKSLIVINQDLKSIKCTQCQKRQLILSVIKSTKCDITLKTDEGTLDYQLPEKVLDT